MEKENIRSLLLNTLALRQSQNSSYSLRAFARDLKVSPATLSQVLSGKRRFSTKNARLVAEALEFSPQQYEKLFSSKISSQDNYFALSDDEFHLISDWYCLGILSLARIKSNKANAGWISERLGITRVEAESGLQRLKRLQLIEVREGRLWRTSKALIAGRDIPSAAIRKYHRSNLQLAIEALERVPMELRDFSAVTFPMESKNLAKAKDLIQRFRVELAELLESEDAKEVYTFALQLFPLTRRKRD